MPGSIKYNLIPFRTMSDQIEYITQWWALKNLLGNIILFIPFGFLLPITYKKFSSTIKVLSMGFASILLIEIFQFFTKLGSFDVDDIILNIIGIVCGYLMFLVINRVNGRPKRAVFEVIVAAVFLISGCAFTGADQDGVNLQEQQKSIEVKSEERERIQAEYDENLEQLETAKQADFQEVLNYYGVMEEKDDSELELYRKLDIQAYYYVNAADSETAENPMVNGWYLLFHNEMEAISLYGLYTEEFGVRGLR